METLTKKDTIKKLLAQGCDERIYTNEDGLIKYWLDINEHKNHIHRGSCTCGKLNAETEQVIENLLDEDLADTATYEALIDEQSNDLKALINYDNQDEFEIFYAPSGSDLVYFPISFCQILHPERPILNILSCPEELGSGTLAAVQGKYHADFNQFEAQIEKGGKVHEDFNVKVLNLNARSEDGKIINHEDYIKEQVELHQDHSIIISLVYGSKSGIEDNLDLINKIERDDIIWMIDMCQFRHSRSIIHRLIESNGCVMITGSKFYQAPPFCGALLTSQKMLEDLKQGDLQQFAKLETVFSGYDFPKSIRNDVGIPLRKNIPLRLRWACSLHEIKQFKKIPANVVREKIQQWNAFINQSLNASESFELMPDQSMTNKTIISFRVKKNGAYLNHQQLKELHRQVVCKGDQLGLGKEKVFIGQPVAYGDKSFLRVAIGANNIRQMVAVNDTQFADDAYVIQIIEHKLAAFEIH